MSVTPKMLQPTMCQALPCVIDSTSSTTNPTTLNATPTPCVMLLANSSMKVLSSMAFSSSLSPRLAVLFNAMIKNSNWKPVDSTCVKKSDHHCNNFQRAASG